MLLIFLTVLTVCYDNMDSSMDISMNMTNNWQDEFQLDKGLLYLNHAAVSPWPRCAQKAVKDFTDENSIYGSRNYLQWLETEQALREQLARLINAPSSSDIALLKNTSEALSVVAHGLDWQSGDNIVSSNEEFPSNRIVWQSLASQGVELRQADLSTNESPEDALFALVDEQTRMIAISSVEYASGLKLDLQRIGEFCQQHEILFCVDAIQSIGALRFDVQTCHIDFAMADGHKWMLGPEGLALFYVRAEQRDALQLHQYGWHMTEDYMNFDNRQWTVAESARRFECGSPNMLAIHALQASTALLLDIGMEEIERRVIDNSSYLIDLISENKDLGCITNTHPERLAGIVTFKHRAKDSQGLYTELMQAGIMCAYRGGGIRFSPHFYTNRETLSKAIDAVIKQ